MQTEISGKKICFFKKQIYFSYSSFCCLLSQACHLRRWDQSAVNIFLLTMAFQHLFFSLKRGVRQACPLSGILSSSFFASYDAMNEYRGDRNVGRKLSTVDGNDNFRRLPSSLVNGKLTFINLKYTCARI